MSTSLTVVETTQNLPALGSDLSAAMDLARAEKAASTRKAYGTDFRIFRVWCEERAVSALPAAPETVAAYLASQAPTSKASTLGRRVAAIADDFVLVGKANWQHGAYSVVVVAFLPSRLIPEALPPKQLT